MIDQLVHGRGLLAFAVDQHGIGTQHRGALAQAIPLHDVVAQTFEVAGLGVGAQALYRVQRFLGLLQRLFALPGPGVVGPQKLQGLLCGGCHTRMIGNDGVTLSKSFADPDDQGLGRRGCRLVWRGSRLGLLRN